MKRLLAALAALLLAGPAAAQNIRYVNAATGSDVNTGTTSGTAWKTIGKANGAITSLGAGWIIYVATGTYGNSPDPAISGSASARITYIGDPGSSATRIRDYQPSVVVFDSRGCTITQDYVTVRGFRFTDGNLTLESFTDHDSVTRSWLDPDLHIGELTCSGYHFLELSQGLDQTTTSNSHVIYDNYIRVNAVWSECGGVPGSGQCFCNGRNHSNLIRKNDIAIFPLACASSFKKGWFWRGVIYTTVDSNRIAFTNPNIPGDGGNFGYGGLYDTKQNLFADNHWTFSDPVTRPDGTKWAMRDSSNNLFVRDTMENLGPAPIWFQIAASGSCPGVNGPNTFDHYIWKNPYGGLGMRYADAVNGDQYLYSTLINRDGVDLVNDQQIRGALVINHCTVADSTPDGPALRIQSDNNATGFIGSFRMTNTLLYNKYTAAPDRTKAGSAFFYFNRYGNAIIDGNLYVHWNSEIPNASGTGKIHIPGIRSILYGNVDRSGTTPTTFIYSRADSIAWRTDSDSSSAAGYQFMDVKSWVADSLHAAGPKFVDSTLATFNPALGSGSGALSRALDGTHIGAWQSTDNTAPDSVGNLQVIFRTATSAMLHFVAPGDDGMTGTCARYEIAYHTVPITTETEYSAAAKFTPNVTPKPAGSVERILIVGLVQSVQYYFSARAFDEVGNRSPLSGSPAAAPVPPPRSGCPDPPCTIED